MLSTGGSGNSISGGSLTFGNNSATAYEGIVHTASNLTIGSAIAENGGNAVSLTKSGPAVLLLTGNNTYTGSTTSTAARCKCRPKAATCLTWSPKRDAPIGYSTAGGYVNTGMQIYGSGGIDGRVLSCRRKDLQRPGRNSVAKCAHDHPAVWGRPGQHRHL